MRFASALALAAAILACQPNVSAPPSPSEERSATPPLATPTQATAAPTATSTPAALTGVAIPIPDLKVACAARPSADSRLALVRLPASTSLPLVPYPIENDLAAAQRTWTIAGVQDPLRPNVLCSVDGAAQARFVTADAIAVTVRKQVRTADSTDFTVGAKLIRHTISSGKDDVILTMDGNPSLLDIAWSRDLSTVAYIEGSAFCDSITTRRLHLFANNLDRILMDIGPCAGRGTSEHDTLALSFSPNGKYFALVNTYGAGKDRGVDVAGSLRVFDRGGTEVFVGQGSDAVWAQDQLYFLGTAGVARWDAVAGVTSALPGVVWLAPSASPDGTTIAYVTSTTGTTSATLALAMYRTDLGRVTPIKTDRALPRYVTPTAFIASADGPCACSLFGHALTGPTFLYDTATGTETTSPIVAVGDVWPR